jgi:hypothetical protein
MAVKLLYGQLFLISDALKAWRGSAALARASQLAINLRTLSQVRRRRVAGWTQVPHAGALAIGGFGRSRWRGGRGGAMGFACAIRDLFVAGVGWAGW